MPRKNRQTIPTRLPNLVVQITDDGSRTLIRTDTGDAYHSASGAAAETRHVYLHNSGIAQRIANGQPSMVLEIGLGTAMGLLMTLDAAAHAGTPLTYTAAEIDWLPADVLALLQPHTWLKDPKLADRFLAFRQTLPETVPQGSYTLDVGHLQRAVIHIGDVRAFSLADQTFDAVYFDPFAPASDPQLWEPALLTRVAGLIKPSGTLVTYCVNRKVRDTITATGLDVKTVPGPVGGKREVLLATKRA